MTIDFVHRMMTAKGRAERALAELHAECSRADTDWDANPGNPAMRAASNRAWAKAKGYEEAMLCIFNALDGL